jgi:hypothetical protein
VTVERSARASIDDHPLAGVLRAAAAYRTDATVYAAAGGAGREVLFA